MPKLTRRQYDVLTAIREYQKENRRPPSLRDLMDATGVTSTSVMDYYLDSLVSKGLITRKPRISRGIEIIKAKHNRSAKGSPMKCSCKSRMIFERGSNPDCPIHGTLVSARKRRALSQQKRIDMVVAKAKAGEQAEAEAGKDVVHDIRLHLFTNGRVRAQKIG